MISLLVLGVVLVYLLVCTVAGFGPAGSLATFAARGQGATRHFADPPQAVLDAYRAGVRATPGMVVAEQVGGTLLVDLRPTSRILGGNFGLVIRLVVASSAAGTVVTMHYQRKVAFALGNDFGAFRQAEIALRMRTKAMGGLHELLGDGDPLYAERYPRVAEPPVTVGPMAPAIAARPRPGWYQDPAGGGGLRFWDGHGWTDSVRPGPA